MSVESFAVELRRLVSGTDVGELAEALDVSERTIRSWTRAERLTSPDVVFTLEDRLGVTPGTLSRHLGYLPVGRDEAERMIEDTVAERVREDAAGYRAGTGPDVARLIDRVDAAAAARRGLQLELMRVAVEDFEAEHGPLTAAEIEQARRDLAGPLDGSGAA